MARVLACCVGKAHVTELPEAPSAQGHCPVCGLPCTYKVVEPNEAVAVAEASDELPLLRSPLTDSVLRALAGESPENIQATFSDPLVLSIIQGAWKAREDGKAEVEVPPEDVVLTAGDAPRDDEPLQDHVEGDIPDMGM